MTLSGKRKRRTVYTEQQGNAEIIPDDVGAVTAVPRRLALLVPTFYGFAAVHKEHGTAVKNCAKPHEFSSGSPQRSILGNDIF